MTATTFSSFSAPGAAGATHAARCYRAAASSGRLLVLAHGAGAGQSHPFMVRTAEGLASRGIDVVTFDFPYMQAKRRSPDRAPVLEDAFRHVIAAALKEVPRVEALFIGGKSMGGRIATHLAAAPDTWSDAARLLAGVVVLGYPLNPPGGPSKRSPDRVSHLQRIKVPTLIVQGTRDNFGSPDDVRAAMPAAQVHAVPTGDHSFNVQKSSGLTQAGSDAAVLDAIAAFATNPGARFS